MTRLGKTLVFINVAFSVLLAAWAFDVWANAIDWSDRKGKTPEQDGEFKKREDRLAELWKGIPPAQAAWLTARRQLAADEAHVAADRDWYAKEMRHVYFTAGTADDALPIGEIVFAAEDAPGVRKGQIVLDAKGFPQLKPVVDEKGTDLQLVSRAEYNKQDNVVLQSILTTIEAHEKQIQEANRLTDRIIGDKAKGIRGLQQRILDEKAKRVDLLAEQKALEEPLVNTVVEGQSILRRRDQLERRIAELKKIGVARSR